MRGHGSHSWGAVPPRMVRDPFKIPPIDDGDACHHLWCSTLALLIYDARSYWQGIKGAGVEFEQAFDDVMRWADAQAPVRPYRPQSAVA